MAKNDSDAIYTEPVTAYLEPDTLKALEKKASADDRTMSSILRLLIKRYISGDFECRKDDGNS